MGEVEIEHSASRVMRHADFPFGGKGKVQD